MVMGAAITPLSEIAPGEQGDCYVLLASKERANTRDGKPYYRVSFRDPGRTATAMIWSDTTWFADCEAKWQIGSCYKIRCQYFENQYGPQVELERIRPVDETDAGQGFQVKDFYEHSRFDAEAMFQELMELAEREIS